MIHLLNCENENDIYKYTDVAKNCKVIKNWLFKQKQVNIYIYYNNIFYEFLCFFFLLKVVNLKYEKLFIII